MGEVTRRDDGSMLVDAGGPTRLLIPAGGPVMPLQDAKDDGYPDVILDIPRAHQGFHRITGKHADEATFDDVRKYWTTVLARRGLRLIPNAGSVVPYINHSRWVADCTCKGGMFCWPKIPQACCLSCGRVYTVNWQLPAERSAVIRVLALREPDNRNWDPRKLDKSGRPVETVEYLERENTLMLGRAR
jgi:hypothetical protein